MFALLSIALVASQEVNVWEETANFFEGLVTRYEGHSYYPSDQCFGETTQGRITDDIIGIGTFASLQRWDKVQRMFDVLLETFYQGVVDCGGIGVLDSARSSLRETTPTQWSLRLYANSVLIYRYCLAAVSEFYQSSWKARGQKIGSCLRYTLPSLS